MSMRLPVLLFVLMSISMEVCAQDDFYNVGTIQQLEIFFADDNWDYQLDTAKLGMDDFIYADSVRINGINYNAVGVKYKGNSSYDSTFAKNPLHISLDEYFEQDYQGHSSIKLSNGYADPSLVREVLAYETVRHYMHAPKSNFARVYVNGDYLGLYSNDQHVGTNFCEDHFLSPNGVLIKGNPIITPGPTTKSNLKYVDADSTSYMNYYELKSDDGWNALVELCDVVTNTPTQLEQWVDVDRMLWMLAFNNVLVNLDSYSGVFAQNYYLYQDTTGRFNPVVWDLNMCFGGFPFLGSGNSSMGSLSVQQMQEMPVVVHANDAYWPLIKALMNEPMYRKMYVAHVRTIANEMIASGEYAVRASEMHSLIADAVSEDENKFFTDDDFDAALNTAVNIGNYDVPGIAELMNARMNFLALDDEFLQVSPTYTSVSSTSVAPVMGETFAIHASVNGADHVWLGRRQTLAAKFRRVPMYDDGLHNDGTSGDGVYGAFVMMTSDSLQYYIYAENENAGVFSPARAEHEFHTVYAAGVSVGLANTAVSVYDATGHMVLKDQLTGASRILHVNQLAAGCYVMKWNNQHQRIHVIH
jgi:spore coat protein CotH